MGSWFKRRLEEMRFPSLSGRFCMRSGKLGMASGWRTRDLALEN